MEAAKETKEIFDLKEWERKKEKNDFFFCLFKKEQRRKIKCSQKIFPQILLIFIFNFLSKSIKLFSFNFFIN